MSDINAVLAIETRNLDARKLTRWLEVIDQTFGTLSVAIEAKRRDDGSVYLRVVGEVE